jgi:large conductance mechanosensitive channel
MKKFAQEFKEFALKGSVIDLAVGIMIGAAFNGVVTSLVQDILTPPIGLLLHNVNFTNLYINLDGVRYANLAAAQAAGAPVLLYGTFINTIISFIITALAIFLLVKQINYLRRRHDAGKEAPPPSTKNCPFCFSTIPIHATRCPNCTSMLDDKNASGPKPVIAGTKNAGAK